MPIEELVGRVAQLERQLGKDSSRSSKPPPSDVPFAQARTDAVLAEAFGAWSGQTARHPQRDAQAGRGPGTRR